MSNIPTASLPVIYIVAVIIDVSIVPSNAEVCCFEKLFVEVRNRNDMYVHACTDWPIYAEVELLHIIMLHIW